LRTPDCLAGALPFASRAPSASQDAQSTFPIAQDKVSSNQLRVLAATTAIHNNGKPHILGPNR
jgi:hypothetical protein